MDWSAIIAGIAAVVAIAGLAYSVRQHQDNIRKEFLLWAIDQLYSPEQRQARKLLFELGRQRTKRAKDLSNRLIRGIENFDEKVLNSDEYGQLRSVFGLFNRIGYFWSRLKYGKKEDALALFPQAIEAWNVSKPFITAIRAHQGEEKSFVYFEGFAQVLEQMKKRRLFKK